MSTCRFVCAEEIGTALTVCNRRGVRFQPCRVVHVQPTLRNAPFVILPAKRKTCKLRRINPAFAAAVRLPVSPRAFTPKGRTDVYLGTLRAPDWMPAAIISRILA